ncbi:hypothetical protein AQUCO_03000276v1 [Aquilegia coerulea]|uniref:Ycf3-interacting protein 1, chloroplastic n=1 Tax=Aquilegia coerulea TaxID=218851 RepID=A0A2G5D303_AQUCA|nr:hypothetical protein AQUCO_03000276v1 [Aquilegia coerulea]
MALQLLQLPITSSSSSRSTETSIRKQPFIQYYKPTTTTFYHRQNKGRGKGFLVFVGTNKQEDSISFASTQQQQQQQEKKEEDEVKWELSPDDQDLEYVRQIQRVLELLKKNRDMLYNEVKLTIMIEDPREVERRRLLGIEDPDSPTREDLVDALDEVKEGRIPENRFALRILAEEMINWPNLEVEIKKSKPKKSLYAKATDTGVDPQVAAKRLNIEWDAAAEIEESDESDDSEVPSAVVRIFL